MTAPVIVLALASAFFLGFAAGARYIVRWRRRQLEKGEEVDPWEFTRRAEAIQIRMSEVQSRCERAAQRGDIETMDACTAEADVLLDNIRQLRLEQIEVQENGWRRPVREL